MAVNRFNRTTRANAGILRRHPSRAISFMKKSARRGKLLDVLHREQKENGSLEGRRLVAIKKIFRYWERKEVFKSEIVSALEEVLKNRQRAQQLADKLFSIK